MERLWALCSLLAVGFAAQAELIHESVHFDARDTMRRVEYKASLKSSVYNLDADASVVDVTCLLGPMKIDEDCDECDDTDTEPDPILSQVRYTTA